MIQILGEQYDEYFGFEEQEETYGAEADEEQ